jgi:hypothetical protein
MNVIVNSWAMFWCAGFVMGLGFMMCLTLIVCLVNAWNWMKKKK